MYEIGNLFAQKTVVGYRLQKVIGERSLTKQAVCTGAGISRPTLDKILSGSASNETTFAKQIEKLLNYFSFTVDELMGSIKNPYVNMQTIMEYTNMDMKTLSKQSGIPVEELAKIQGGEDVPLIEVREVAAHLGIGVHGLLGTNYFQTMVATADPYCYTENELTIQTPGGFWGHIGFNLKCLSRRLWFPITRFTRAQIYQNITEPYLAVPCMDNSLLIINSKSIKDLTILDDACDEPVGADWDDKISCGEIPGVFYDAFQDYADMKATGGVPKDWNFSEQLAAYMDRIVAKYHLDVDAFSNQLTQATVIFEDGSIQTYNLNTEAGMSDLTFMATSIYEAGEPLDGSFVAFQDDQEMEVMINLENVSMVKLPLAVMEDAIAREQAEVIADIEKNDRT